jgi:hypothetical protein
MVVLRTESDVAYESSPEPIRLAYLPGYLRGTRSGTKTGKSRLAARFGQE